MYLVAPGQNLHWNRYFHRVWILPEDRVHQEAKERGQSLLPRGTIHQGVPADRGPSSQIITHVQRPSRRQIHILHHVISQGAATVYVDQDQSHQQMHYHRRVANRTDVPATHDQDQSHRQTCSHLLVKGHRDDRV